METVGHWWNRRPEGNGRRDVWLRTDTRRWEVEHRESAARERSTRRTYLREEEARRVLAEWLADVDGWEDISGEP
jgi:hypothetical protein